MIHANRIVTVGEQECIIDRPIILYRGDREVEIEFTLVGNEFMFSKEGNVIESVNASHGQLVLNTPSGEHMFSELAECNEGKVVFVVTKEMIDEFIEVGFYSFQIRLYDSAEMKSRVTIPPVMNGFDIRNPIAAEDEVNIVDQGLVDYARVFKDQSNEELYTFDWTGAYNKTEWEHHDVITENKLNKIEDALYSINATTKELGANIPKTLDQVKKDADKYVKEHIAAVEADVEEFERNLNTDVQKFKIDTNAAMTAHKNEVSEVVDGFSGEIESINSQLARIENRVTVSVRDFGAMGDGITDDTQAIKRMCEYVNAKKNAHVIFPKGTYKVSVEYRDNYWHDDRPYIALFKDCTVSIDLCDSTIVMESTLLPWYSMFEFEDCKFKISNGELIGDRLNHDYDTSYRGITSNEWGYGIHNYGSTGKVDNVKISQFTGDGIISGNNHIWTPSFTVLSRSYIEIDNCEIHHCRRQGITIGESNGGIIKNTHIHHIGNFDDINGAAPKSGIDLEFELLESYCECVMIDNVTIDNCTNFAVVGAIDGDLLNKLIILNSNINGRMAISNSPSAIIENSILNLTRTNDGICHFDDFTFNKCNITFDESSTLLNRCTFNNCTIQGVYNSETGLGTSLGGDSLEFNNCKITDILGNSKTYSWSADLAGKPLTGFDKWIYNSVYTFNNCQITNCSSISKSSNTLPTYFNSCTINDCYFINASDSATLIYYTNCNINNLAGYYVWGSPYVFKRCSIRDDGTLSPSFVGCGMPILYNCDVNITKTSTSKDYYYMMAYNSFIDYTVPTNADLSFTKLYNCYYSSNVPKTSFKGVMENTTYVEKQ